MTKKLVWRLAEKPSAAELRELVTTGILTKEEAKQIIFSTEEEAERDKKSLESEIKFLRELVEKLSNSNRNTIVETIKYIDKPYIRWEWYKPYSQWCSSQPTGGTSISYTASNADNTVYGAIGSNTLAAFKDIKSF